VSSLYSEIGKGKYKFNVPSCSENFVKELMNQFKLISLNKENNIDKKPMAFMIKQEKSKFQFNFLKNVLIEICSFKKVMEKDCQTQFMLFTSYLEELRSLPVLNQIDREKPIEEYKKFFTTEILKMSRKYDKNSFKTSTMYKEVEPILINLPWFESPKEEFDTPHETNSNQTNSGSKLFHKLKAFTKGSFSMWFFQLLNIILQNPEKRQLLVNSVSIKPELVKRLEDDNILTKINSKFDTQLDPNMSVPEKKAFLDIELIKNYIFMSDLKDKNNPTYLQTLEKFLCRNNENKHVLTKFGMREVNYESIVYTSPIKSEKEVKQTRQEVKENINIMRRKVDQSLPSQVQAFKILMKGKVKGFFCSKVVVNLKLIHEEQFQDLKFVFTNQEKEVFLNQVVCIDKNIRINGISFSICFESTGCMSNIKNTKGVFRFNKSTPQFLEAEMNRKSFGFIEVDSLKLLTKERN
jgi:hypothetical protein